MTQPDSRNGRLVRSVDVALANPAEFVTFRIDPTHRSALRPTHG